MSNLTPSFADMLLLMVDAEEKRRSLKQFVMGAWATVEPSPYVDGWAVDAICEHLEALTSGAIRFLLINVPPRHSKSTICSVLWPVWCWLQKPEDRFLCASYSLDLAIRDNLKKRNLIESPWFQERYGKDFTIVTGDTSFKTKQEFTLSSDQNAKRFFSNDKLGYQMATSVGSTTTGQGGSKLLCLCYNTEVTTDIGRIYIGDIVEKKLSVKVLAFAHTANATHWQDIERYEDSPGRPCVRVTFSDGRVVDATEDHPFYVIGKGYVDASQLTNTDKVIVDEGFLSAMWEGVRSSAISNRSSPEHFLQPQLSLRQKRGREKTSQSCMSGMWQRSRAITRAHRSSYWHLLQSCLPWNMGNRTKQPCVSRRQGGTTLRQLPESVLPEAKPVRQEQKRFSLLLENMSASTLKRRTLFSLSFNLRCLRLLREADQNHRTQSRQKELLHAGLCQQSAQFTHARRRQREIYRWWGHRSLFSRISSISSYDQRTRWTQVRALPQNTSGEWQGIRCPSYRLRQRPQRSFKSGFPVSMVPWQNAWQFRTKGTMETLLVRCVEPISTPERVYNLRIAEDHNYFANGVLVHNCDDPHSAMEAHSAAERLAAATWFRETWSNRMNDASKDVMSVIGQRIHEEDISGIIRRERRDWIYLNLPAEYEPANKCYTSIGWSDPRTTEGELLWPERFNQETLNRYKRDLGSLGFAAQYQQRPVPAGGGQFKRQWFRYFTAESDHYALETPECVRNILVETCHKFITVDLAISQKQSADYTVISIWVVTPENELLLLDRLRDRLDNPEQQKQIQLLYQRYHPDYIQIENVAYQLAIIQQLWRLGLPVREYKPVRDKVSRASTAAVLYEGGRVYHPKNASWLQEWEDEFLTFPLGSHDDQVDTCSMACDAIGGPTVSTEEQLRGIQRRVELANQRQIAPAQGAVPTQSAMLPQKKKGWWET